MSAASAAIAAAEHRVVGPARPRSLLRFLTCGSVDDGKSTLIGRLLYETRAMPGDEFDALERDSRRAGTRGGKVDFALLVDGLAAEREQGITIDVAYRFFATGRRKFIVADTPGHAQYTRNMVTGASNADLAVILVDARKGLLLQTRRHSYLVSLLGIRHVVLAVNKMDLVGYSREVFDAVAREYSAFVAALGFEQVTAVPMSAVEGVNVSQSCEAEMPWYGGPTLLRQLETVDVDQRFRRPGFRMPVQWVNRPDQDFRGFAGRIAAGQVHVGDRVRILPAGNESTVARIVTADGDLEAAQAGKSVTLTLAADVDVSRGDVIASAHAPPGIGSRFEATIVWMHEEPLRPGRSYVFRLGTRVAAATVSPPRHRVDVSTLECHGADSLALNDIGVCEVALDRAVAFEPYATSRELGGFLLIDRESNHTVAAGLLRSAVRASAHVHWHATRVAKEDRARRNGQRPCVVWLTGLSGAGKSTIANRVEQQLFAMGRHTYLLDGDNLRHGLTQDLGFAPSDRVENVRRVAEVARLMVDAGLIVLVALISPYRADRALARARLGAGEFHEIFVDVSLEAAERRDPKGLYRKARRGEISQFTGIDSPYEPPQCPHLRIDAESESADDAARRIVAYLGEHGVLDAVEGAPPPAPPG
jgi:bifunctional enzyme CysN/CysC